jgi:hypothetical protein
VNALLLLLGLLGPGPTIAEVGYCVDVVSASCPVRDYWPRSLRITSVGQDAYYFVDAGRPARVAFVPREVYVRFTIGMLAPEGLVWRERLP